MTRHVAAWSLLRPPTNALLRQAVPKVGIIPNYAWKRQLDQFTRKFPIAQRFGGVFALVMGKLLFRYIRGLFPADCSYFPEWEIALLGVAETPSTTPGPIRIDHVQDALFLSFADFIAAVQDFPLPEAMSDPFAGTYTTMTNEDYQVIARPGSLGEAPALPMPAIRSKGTKPERLVFAALKARKIFFAAHVDTLLGKPDIVFHRKKVAVFIDSDFWHGNPERFILPKSNTDYWEAKIARNRARDIAVAAELSAKGWSVLRLWEWDIVHNFDAQFSRLLLAIGREEAASI